MNIKDKKDPSSTPKATKTTTRTPVNPIDKAKMLAMACAALCALALGAVVYAAVSVNGAASEVASIKATTTPTVVATVDISSGSVIGLESVRIADVPTTLLSSGASSDLTSVIGKTATANIPANGQIAQSNLAGAGNVSALAEAVEPGMIAASVAVNSETGVAGLIRQGDYVDVLAEGSTMIERVRVLALDTQLKGDITQYSTVTLEMTVEQAGEIQSAQLDNPVRLVLNSHTTTSAEVTQ